MAEPYLLCPSTWTRSTLQPSHESGIITRVDSGGTPSTAVDDYWDGDIPWLTPKEITAFDNQLFVSHTERKITLAGLENSGARLVPPGTVMLTKRAPVGAVAVNAVPMATNQGFLSFHCGPLLKPLYLAYWLRANKPYLEKVANGSTYPELYLSDLFEFEISVPLVHIQERIIDVLNALQYAALLGLSLEQSVADPKEMVILQEQNRRLAAIRDELLPLLLSGVVDARRLEAVRGLAGR